MTVLKDLKEALSSVRKPDITHVRKVLLTYVARACEYGSSRYVRGNYLRPVNPAGYTGTPSKEDFERLRSYLRALVSHATSALDEMELHLSRDPDLADVDGMKRAAYAEDTDEPPEGSKVGASHLPHLAHAGASLMMALAQAVLCGLLPQDPGQTWKDRTIAPDPEPERKKKPHPLDVVPHRKPGIWIGETDPRTTVTLADPCPRVPGCTLGAGHDGRCHVRPHITHGVSTVGGKRCSESNDQGTRCFLREGHADNGTEHFYGDPL